MLQLIHKNRINQLLITLLATLIPLAAMTKNDSLLEPAFSYSYHSCEEGSITIAFKDESTTPGIASWSWEFSDGQRSTQQNPIFAFQGTQMLGVRLTITTLDGATETTTQTIDVQVIENVFIRGNLLLCPGGSLPLNPNGNTNYQYLWSPAEGLSDPTASNPLAAPSQSTNYSVTITNTSGLGTCEIVKQVEIFVPPPIVLSLTQDFSTCEPTATLTVDTDPIYDINWFDSEGNKIGKDLEITITPKGRQVYFVEVIDEFGCSAKDAVTVEQVTPPEVSVIPSNPLCGTGNLGSAIATVTGGSGPYIFLWSNGETGDAIENLPQDSYTVTVTDANNCTAEATTSIVEVPDISVSATISNPVCGGECTGSIIPQISGATGNISFEWSDGFPDLERTGLCADNYVLKVTDGSGCTSENSFDIIAPSPIEVNVISPQGASCVAPGIGQLIAIASGGSGSLSYNWDIGSISDTISNLQPGSYTVTVTDENGCQGTGTGAVLPPGEISTSIVADFDPCSNGPTEISLSVDPSTSGIASYEWMVNGTIFTDPTLTLPISPGEMIDVLLKITTDEGCEATADSSIVIEAFLVPQLIDSTLCSGTSLALNPEGNPEYIYVWSPEEGLSNPTIANPTVIAMESTDYLVTVTNGTCVQLDTLSLQVLPTPTLEAEGDTALCTPASVMITANTDLPDHLVWSLNPDFSDTLSSDPELIIMPDSSQNYYVRVLDENGCSASDVVMIQLDPINIPSQASQRVCSGQPAQINVIADPQALDLSFSWTPANVITQGANTCCPTILAMENVDLTANITNETTGCTSELVVDVTVDDVESVEATADPPRIYRGESSQLNVTNGDPTLNYIWQPGTTLNNSNIQNPVATPSETTTYNVNIVSPTEQCASTRMVTVIVIECGEPFIFFPNAFSPNGDGENDMLFLRANNVDNSRFIIFNRWGEQVFESRSINVGWDGTLDGEKVNPDVYGYFLEVTCANGEIFNKKGNVTVLK